MSSRGDDHDGQTDEKGEAGQGFRGGDLSPDQGEAEPTALGVANLLFDGYPAVIKNIKMSEPRSVW